MEGLPSSSSPTYYSDWVVIIQKFHESVASREQVLKDYTEEKLLGALLHRLSSTTQEVKDPPAKDKLLKIKLLVFLQENLLYFLEAEPQRVEIVCSRLNELLEEEQPNNPSHSFLKSQVLVCLTTLMLELDVIRTLPNVFEGFVELLLSYASKVNNSNQRVLRATAFGCLEELELFYPGLFHKQLPTVLSYCQEEETHVQQATVLFLSSIFLNHLKLSQHKEKPSLQFINLPTSTLKYWTSNSIQTLNITDVTKEKLSIEPTFVSMAEVCPQMTVCGLACLMNRLFLAYRLAPSEVDSSLFIQYFFPLMFLHSPDLLHYVLLFVCLIPGSNNQNHFFHSMLLTLSNLIHHENWSVEKRILVVRWFQSLEALIPKEKKLDLMEDDKPLLYSLSSCFNLSIFDDWHLLEAKLSGLLCCFDAVNAPPPRKLVTCLQCMEEFWYYPPTNYRVLSAFRVLVSILRAFPTLLFQDIHSYILGLIFSHPKFLGNVITMVESFKGDRKQSSIYDKFLESFNDVMISFPIRNNPAHFASYLPLVNTILQNEKIDPTELLKVTYTFLSLIVWTGCNVSDAERWRWGNTVLGIACTVLRHHSTALIFNPLSALLLFCCNSKYFVDVDIQDRAHFYYQLLTHVHRCSEGMKLDIILNPPGQSGYGEVEESEIMDSVSNTSHTSQSSQKPDFSNLKSKLSEAFTIKKLERTGLEGMECYEEYGEFTRFQKGMLETTDEYSFFKAYLNFVHSPEFHPCIEIPFAFWYSPSFTSSQSSPQKIYSLVISFSSSPLYSALLDVHIPYLEAKREKTTNSYEFPYEYCFDISFQPLAPIPTSFEVCVSFNDGEGNIHKTNVCPLSLQFSDLFLPLPLPPNYLERFTPKILWDHLWAAMKPKKNEKKNTQSSGKNSCAHSVKFLPISEAQMMNVFNGPLKRFLFHTEKNVFCVAIFLSPQYHLLMRFQTSDLHSVITYRTDYWRVLTYLDAQLDDLFASVS